MAKILLNNKKSVESPNRENRLPIALTESNRILPLDNINKNVDEYKQYLKEKEASKKYRLTFTINPVCTNVLFNNISEIVYKEGSDECVYFNSTGMSDSEKISDNIRKYLKYKDVTSITTNTLTREELIRDTGFSHPDIGPIVYHCGYDIFNNHMLRKKEFAIVNKIGDTGSKTYFNTLMDWKRHANGEIVKERIPQPGKAYNDEINTHLYQISTVYSFDESIVENLIEENGWVGFLNKTTLDIPNYTSISLNKVMNNNKPNEFIDMYPDRSLYSFIPKVNKYRNNRIEPNWDYCLTYPCENDYDHELVRYKSEDNTIEIKGIECYGDWVNKIGDDDFNDEDENIVVELRTRIKHNFKKGSLINLTVIGEIVENNETTLKHETLNSILSINNVGKDGYTFEIYGEELIEVLYHFVTIIEIRATQVINGCECEYYLRKFRKVPNLKKSISNSGTTEASFNSLINKMGFSKNIYSDDVAQIIFNDDIELSELKDNLGRELSEIYLTIIKNNDGNKEWYNGDYCNSSVTFSHCFSDVTSGIDMMDTEYHNYNVHKIHNVPTGVTKSFTAEQKYQKYISGWTTSYDEIFVKNDKQFKLPKVLENGITKDKEFFYGDIVEFSPATVNEVVLEKIYHRFNTMQREFYASVNTYDFYNLPYDEIIMDDYERIAVTDNKNYFSAVTKNYNTLYINQDEKVFTCPANISPEGYFYEPHYKIPLRTYGKKVHQGSHTYMTFQSIEETNKEDEKIGGGDLDNPLVNDKFPKYQIKTTRNFFLEVGKTLYLYNREDPRDKKIARITWVGKKPFIEARIKLLSDPELSSGQTLNNKYDFYKPNSEQPEHSYELKDGSGRYLWRDFIADNEYEYGSEIGNYVFTNGAHYINQNINFFLRRQDPDGSYHLSNASREISMMRKLTIDGYSVDNTNIEYNDLETEGMIC